jgi:hypothetical protein
MRKRLITPTPQDTPAPNEQWLDLESAAVVEVTSEEKGYPVESALVSGETVRNKAAGLPGDALTDEDKKKYERPAEELIRYLLFANEALLRV